MLAAVVFCQGSHEVILPPSQLQEFGRAIGHSGGSRSEYQALSRGGSHEHPLASRGLSYVAPRLDSYAVDSDLVDV